MLQEIITIQHIYELFQMLQWEEEKCLLKELLIQVD